eukprot:scaffold6592_cov411-Prasinococcus_capsulatus_cf.AAC.1
MPRKAVGPLLVDVAPIGHVAAAPRQYMCVERLAWCREALPRKLRGGLQILQGRLSRRPRVTTRRCWRRKTQREPFHCTLAGPPAPGPGWRALGVQARR